MQSNEHVSNEQLLATLAGRPAASALMQRYGGLTNLSQASFEDLRQVPGIGQSRAAAVRSAFLIAQRLARESYGESPLLDTPERVADLLREEYRPCTVENFHVLCLNTRRRLIAVERVGQGILDSVMVHAREVFVCAISKRASAVILVHNHPSGDPLPSEADLRITRDIVQAGRILKITVLDHVIIGRQMPGRERDYVSLRESGHIT